MRPTRRSRPATHAVVTLLACLGLHTAPGTAQAQRAPSPELDAAFEEVVLRASTPGEPDQLQAPGRPAARTIIGRGASLRSLIGWAYPVQRWQIAGGPDWIDERAFEVVLVFRPGIEGADRAAAIQRLLAARFELEAHYETAPVYILDAAAGGPRLEASVRDGAALRSQLDEAPGRITGRAATLGALTSALSRYLGRPVLDHTALPGRYDFVVEWPLEQPLSEALAEDVSGAGRHPGLVAALERELGLELRSFPLELLIVDRAVRPE